MKLLVIRHAIAEDRETFAQTGEEDALRPLTKAGRRKMRRVAKGIQQLVPDLTVLATSPYTRAVQTGQIVASRYSGLQTVHIPQLTPRKTVQALLQWIQTQPPDATVALVGHEPHLGVFVSWMMTGLQESFVVLKKGGVCLLEITGEVKAGRAKLHWLMKPSQLRRLA
ncbi:MAG: phosphohistidine phosphatase [Phycisphaerales bacterium]|nr:phosphohistidine phosphatase [Phycisphaerales bacterium]